jgi:hypothetical protein
MPTPLVAQESDSPLPCRGPDCRNAVGKTGGGFTLPFCASCFGELRPITRLELAEVATASVYDVDAVCLAVRRMRAALRELGGKT